MSAPPEQPQSRPRPRRSGLGPAIAYYAGMGLLGVGLAAWFVLSLVETVAAGYCESGGGIVCGHHLQDLVAPSIAALVGGTLLPTASQLRRDPPGVGPVVAVGAIVGVLIALLPNVLILLAGASDGTINIFGQKTPVLGLLAIFVWPLLWAVTSAITVWREAAQHATLTTHLVAAGGVTAVAVLGMFALMTSSETANADVPDLHHALGTATLRIERPVAAEASGEVLCATLPSGELQVHLDAVREEPRPGTPVYGVIFTAGERLAIGRGTRDDGLEVLIEIWRHDRMPEEIGSTPDSRLELQRDGPRGTIRFAGLEAATYGDDGRQVSPSGVEGTFAWTCPDA